mmetsp:Transcript_50611/g.147141  ORF Transcript_50611/g.147141 Transcript_50611/m.147141 type:complete len:248 (+) Transcript_50611:406-1149(+)
MAKADDEQFKKTSLTAANFEATESTAKTASTAHTATTTSISKEAFFLGRAGFLTTARPSMPSNVLDRRIHSSSVARGPRPRMAASAPGIPEALLPPPSQPGPRSELPSKDSNRGSDPGATEPPLSGTQARLSLRPRATVGCVASSSQAPPANVAGSASTTSTKKPPCGSYVSLTGKFFVTQEIKTLFVGSEVTSSSRSFAVLTPLQTRTAPKMNLNKYTPELMKVKPNTRKTNRKTSAPAMPKYSAR